MARAARTLDVSDTPDLLHLAEEVARTREPRVLVKEAQELVVVVPVDAPSRPARQIRRAAGGSIAPLSLDQIYRTVPALPEPLSDREMAMIATDEHAAHVAREGLAGT